MIITTLGVGKLDPCDPRYPEPDAMKRPDGSAIPFSEVYLCECTVEGGQKFETAFWVTSPMTTDRTSNMLQAFAAAILRMGHEAEAA